MATAKSSYIVAPNPNDGINGVLPVGSIVMWGTLYPPSGWLVCDGTEYSVTQYPALYDVIGRAFGSPPPGRFVVPDTRSVTIRGSSGDGRFSDPGQTGGGDSATLNDQQLPSHIHSITDPGHNHVFLQNVYNDMPSGGLGQYQGNGQDPGPPNGYQFRTGVPAGTLEPTNITGTNGNTTANNPIDITNAYLVLNFIIKAV